MPSGSKAPVPFDLANSGPNMSRTCMILHFLSISCQTTGVERLISKMSETNQPDETDL